MLYTYRRYTDKLLDVFYLLLAVLLSELRENPRRKYWVTEEKYIARICVKDIIFWLHARPPPPLLPLLCCRFFCLLPSPKNICTRKWWGRGAGVLLEPSVYGLVKLLYCSINKRTALNSLDLLISTSC